MPEDKEKEQIRKMLEIGQSAKAKIYLNLLSKIKEGKNLTEAESKRFEKLEEELKEESKPEEKETKSLILKVSVAADFFNITRQGIYFWFKRGCPKRGYGKCDLKEVFEWWKNNIIKDPDGVGTYGKARTESERYKADLRKIELEEKRGQLVSVEEVRKAAFDRGRQMRDAFLNLPDQVGPILAAESSDRQVTLLLTKEIRKILEELAKGKKPTKAKKGKE